MEEPLIKPKEEPIDPNDEENTSHSGKHILLILFLNS